jgi:hypothetical protein
MKSASEITLKNSDSGRIDTLPNFNEFRLRAKRYSHIDEEFRLGAKRYSHIDEEFRLRMKRCPSTTRFCYTVYNSPKFNGFIN